METIKFNNRKLILFFLAVISNFAIVNTAQSQSALHQLETAAGQSVNTQSPPTPNCVCAYCGYPCGSGHSSGCPYNNGEVSSTTTYTDKNLSYRKEKANTYNDKGNTNFRNGNYRDAVADYGKARFYNSFDETIKKNYAAAKRALKAQNEEKRKQKKPAAPKPVAPKPSQNTSVTTNSATNTTQNNSQYTVNTSQNTTVTTPTTNVAPTYIPPIKDVKQYGNMYVAQSRFFNTLINSEIIDADNPYIKVTEGIMDNPSVLVYDTIFQKEEEKKHPQIEYYRKVGVALFGIFPKGINYGLIVGNNLIFKNIAVYTDIYNGTENREIHEAQVFTVVNALKQSEFDVAMSASADALIGNGLKIAGAGIVRATEGAAAAINNSFSVIAPKLGSEAGSTLMTSGRNVSELVLSKTAENASTMLSVHLDLEDAKEELLNSYDKK